MEFAWFSTTILPRYQIFLMSDDMPCVRPGVHTRARSTNSSDWRLLEVYGKVVHVSHGHDVTLLHQVKQEWLDTQVRRVPLDKWMLHILQQLCPVRDSEVSVHIRCALVLFRYKRDRIKTLTERTECSYFAVDYSSAVIWCFWGTK